MTLRNPISSMRIRTMMLLLFGGGTSLLMSVFAIINLVGIPFVGINGEYRRTTSAAIETMSQIADQQQQVFARFFHERVGDCRALAENPAIHSAFRSGADLTQVTTYLEQVGVIFGFYDTIDLIQSNGIVLSSIHGERVGAKSGYHELLADIDPASDYPLIFFSSKKPQDQMIVIAMALHSEDYKDASGFVVMEIAMTTFSEHLLKPEAILGKTGEILLVDMVNTLLNPARYPGVDGKVLVPLKDHLETMPALFSAWGVDSMVHGADYRGVQVVAFVRHLRITPEFAIGMVIKRDVSELYGDARKNLFVSLGIAGSVVLMMVALVLLAARQLGRPLELLSMAALRIKNGDLDARAEISSGFEAAHLAECFNTMAEHVQRSQRELEQQVAERTRELAESRAFLQSALDNASTVIYLKDRQGRYLFINRAFEELFHVTRTDVFSKTDFDIFPEATAAIFWNNDAQVVEQRSVMSIEECAPHADGSLHQYLSCKFPMYDELGEVYAVGGISTDIAERKQREEDVRETKEHLET